MRDVRGRGWFLPLCGLESRPIRVHLFRFYAVRVHIFIPVTGNTRTEMVPTTHSTREVRVCVATRDR